MKTLLKSFFLILPLSLQAQVMVGPSDPLMEDLKTKALSQGRVLPFSTFPQPLNFLKKVYDSYAGPDEPAPDWFRQGLYGRAVGSAQLVGRLSGPRDSFWDSYSLYGVNSESLVTFGLGLQDESRWCLFMSADFSQEFSGWEPTNLYWPKPDNLFPLENHFLTRGYFWYNFEPLTLEIGRDKIHYGPFDSSLAMSYRLPFFDMVRAHLPLGDWSFDWVVATPETRTGGGGLDISNNVLMTLHRLEYGQSSFRVAWSELYLVQRGPNGPFTMTDILPFYVLHQADMAPNNVSEILEMNWSPLPDWGLMASLAFDDINANIAGMPDYGTPTIWAFMLGTDIQGRTSDFQWNFHGEMGMTHYLFGIYEDAYPLAKARYLIILDAGTKSMPMTSPYGPGTLWLDTRTSFSFKPFEISIVTELWNTRNGVNQDILYQAEKSYEGLGDTWNYRGRGKFQWTFLNKGTLGVQVGILGRNGDLTPEGQLSLKWAYDTAPLPGDRSPAH